MGKPKRYNAYDSDVKQKRLEVQSYGAQRQRLSINSSFRGQPLEPPISTPSALIADSSASSVTFPITPTINDHGNVGTTTEDLDLSLTTGHVHKITLTGNPTLTFSNPPTTGTQMEFEIEFVQDGTGSRTVTWPATVVETVSISSTASSTTIVTVRTNDGGTNYHAIPALRGSISLSGSVYANLTLSNLGATSINTSLISDTDATDDLGTSAIAWKTLYVDTISNAATTAVASPIFSINSATINLGDAITDAINFLGRISTDILPIADATHDLGSSALAFAEVWVDTIRNAATTAISSPTTSITSATINLGDAVGDDINILGQVATNIVIEEITIPAASPANTGRFYAKVDGGVSVPFWMDEAGTETSMIGSSILGDNNTWTGTNTWNGTTNTFAGTTFNINTTTINFGDAGTDQVNILANKVLPALDATTQLGETAKAWKEVWVDTIRNDATTAVSSPTFSISSATINMGDAITDAINFLGRINSDIIPIADATHDLGTSALAYAQIYVDTINNAATTAVASPTFSINSATINLGDAVTDTINFLGRSGSDILPIADGTHDLGSGTLEWQDLFIDGIADIDRLENNGGAIAVGDDLDFDFGDTVDYNAGQSTVGSAGVASSLPSAPTGYIIVKKAGTEVVIPYYDKT